MFLIYFFLILKMKKFFNKFYRLNKEAFMIFKTSFVYMKIHIYIISVSNKDTIFGDL